MQLEEHERGTGKLPDYRPGGNRAAAGAAGKTGRRLTSLLAELLAILLRVGVQGENAVQVGQRLLKDFGSLTGLHRAAFEDVQSKGVGRAKAAQIKAAIELGKRMAKAPEELPAIHSPADAAALVSSI